MDSANLLKGLFKKLGNENNFVGGDGGGHMQLSPYLALVVSILYMMVADGEISDQETSQLQSVVGKDDAVLKRALHYVATTTIDQFLADVPAVLDSQDSLCVLMNVCDSIMADGELAELELNLFQRLLSALGHSKKSFRSYFNTISIKNKKSVLGSFENFDDKAQLTPQLALAASMLYMMSVDGSMAEEEIGQLNVVIGRSEGLLQAGLKYVRQNKFQQFISETSAMLNTAQKLCILTNVCDSMMSDGEVADIEMELFRRMLTAFNLSEKKFQPYFTILSRKNNKPEEKEDQDNIGGFIPARSKKKEEEGFNFDRKIVNNENKRKAPGDIDSAADEEAEPGEVSEETQLGIIINRKMRDNINKMSESIDGENGIQDITDNANSMQQDDEQTVREHHDKKSLAPDSFARNDSIHYLDKETADTGVNGDVKLRTETKETRLALSSRKRIKKDHVTHRSIKDSRTLIPNGHGKRRGTSPSDLRVITDSDVEFDGSPLQVRMTIVQTRTDEINQTLDKLNDVSEAQFQKRSLILSAITFSPAPIASAVAPKTDNTASQSLTLVSPITRLHKEKLLVTENISALEKSETTAGFQKMKMKIACLFGALIIAHGFSSVGESTAQSHLIQNNNQVSNTHATLQALAAQQTIFRVAADELDASLSRKESFSIEQLEIEKNKLAAYRKKIEDLDSAPVTGDGKKELLAKRAQHETFSATESKMMQWFVLSKAILLFGIGLSVCGFFFKSRFIFYGAVSAAVLGSLLSVNGFFLFV